MPVVEGRGTPGAAVGQVLTVQGVLGGTSLPVTTVPGATSPTAFAFEAVTITDSSTALTSGTYSNATVATLTLETAQIRYRLDGTAPTSAVGHLLEVGQSIVLEGAAAIAAWLSTRAAIRRRTCRKRRRNIHRPSPLMTSPA
mgnify:CR=1 FL=1